MWVRPAFGQSLAAGKASTTTSTRDETRFHTKGSNDLDSKITIHDYTLDAIIQGPMRMIHETLYESIYEGASHVSSETGNAAMLRSERPRCLHEARSIFIFGPGIKYERGGEISRRRRP